jgi:hypothetical protein
MSHSRFWLIGAGFALLVFALPIAVMNATASRDPELRIIMSGSNVTALLVTETSRTLITSSNDRGATRSAIGFLARPWEPKVTTLVSPANDRAAIGLWESLRLPSVRQVVIVGIPGSDPIWSVIERECRDRNIDLVYAGTPLETSVDLLNLVMYPSDDNLHAYISVEHHGLSVAIALGSNARQDVVHALISDRPPDTQVAAELLVLPSAALFEQHENVVYVREREVVTLRISEEAVTVSNGRLQMTATPSS